MEPGRKVTIELSGLRFFGHYGLYPVESKWETELLIDLSVRFNLSKTDTIDLKDTIDYSDIYKTVATELKNEHQLLEVIAIHLIKRIKELDARIINCKVRISKKPILGGPLDQVAVEMEY